MSHWSKLVLATAVVAILVPAVYANPALFVTYEGVNGSNHQWLVAVAPDPNYFVETTSGFGSSLATELAFAVEGSSIVDGSVAINNSDWPAQNPGNNPFLDSVTTGVWLSGPLDGEVNQAFASLGSNVFLSGVPVPLFGFQTVGTDPTTVKYGVAASGHPTKGSIIAQAGQNFPPEFAGFASGGLSLLAADLSGMGSGGGELRVFSGYTGSVSSVPEPTTALLSLAMASLGLCSLGRRRG